MLCKNQDLTVCVDDIALGTIRRKLALVGSLLNWASFAMFGRCYRCSAIRISNFHFVFHGHHQRQLDHADALKTSLAANKGDF